MEQFICALDAETPQHQVEAELPLTVMSGKHHHDSWDQKEKLMLQRISRGTTRVCSM